MNFNYTNIEDIIKYEKELILNNNLYLLECLYTDINIITNSIKKTLKITNNNTFEDNIILLDKILYLKPNLDKITLDMANGCIYKLSNNNEIYKYINNTITIDKTQRINKWMNNNILHKTNGPAYVEKYINGIIKKEEWYIEGKLHCKNGPAYIERYIDGTIKKQEWYTNNIIGSDEGPAIIEYYNDGMIKIIQWYINGVLHRLNKPAYIERYNDGLCKHIQWYKDGFIHRDNEPAIIIYNNNYYIKEWYINNQHYREDGPVIEEWWYNDRIKKRWYNKNNYEEYDTNGILICKCNNDNGNIIIDVKI